MDPFDAPACSSTTGPSDSRACSSSAGSNAAAVDSDDEWDEATHGYGGDDPLARSSRGGRVSLSQSFTCPRASNGAEANGSLPLSSSLGANGSSPSLPFAREIMEFDLQSHLEQPRSKPVSSKPGRGSYNSSASEGSDGPGDRTEGPLSYNPLSRTLPACIRRYDSMGSSDGCERRAKSVSFTFSDGASVPSRVDFRPRLKEALGTSFSEKPPELKWAWDLPSGSSASVMVLKTADDELVVAKRIQLTNISDRAFSELVNEVLLLASLRHRHIVKFHGTHCTHARFRA